MPELSSFHGIHAGADIVVCGCGPSLDDLEHPEAFLTIGVNDVGRRFDPDYLVVVNPERQFAPGRFRHVRQSRARAVFSQYDLPLEHAELVRARLGRYQGVDLSDPGVLHFTQNSPYVAVCLAAQMGARTIGLIGVDFTDHHFFADTGLHPLAGRVSQIDAEYGALRQALERRGVDLVNLSARSRLTQLPKVGLDVIRRRGGASYSTRTGEAGPATSGLSVVHVSLTNCAGALWNLHGVLTRHGGVESRVITASATTSGRSYPRDILFSETGAARAAIEAADVVHFHNFVDAASRELSSLSSVLKGKPAVLQFHSEPALVRSRFPGRDPATRTDLPTLVVAQKQARFYPNAVPVPNAVDIHAPALTPAGTHPPLPMRVLYTPSDTAAYRSYAHTCRGKGYRETTRVLAEVEARGFIEARVETEVPLSRVLELRRSSHVVVDECVTGGYHLTSLESLAQGLATVAYLDDETVALLCDLTGSSPGELPWVNARMAELTEALVTLASEGERLWSVQAASRAWMERYWTPAFLLRHYAAAYHRALDGGARARAAQLHRHGSVAGHHARVGAPAEGPTDVPEPDAPIRYEIPGRARRRISEDFPQTIHLGPDLLRRAGEMDGGVCHILGNGPSVDDTDLAALGDVPVITVNSGSLLFDGLGRSADFYCVSDRRFLARPECLEMARQAGGSTRVFAGYCAGFLPDDDIHYARILGGDGISEDLVEGVYHGCSVVLFAAQLALWLGAGDLVFHGCGFDFSRGRFRADASSRPSDSHTYPRIRRNFARLAAVVRGRGGTVSVVGPSRLTGSFRSRSVPGIRGLTADELPDAAARPAAARMA